MLTILQFEDILMMHQAYKGLQVTFPKRLYSKDYVRGKVISEYNGSNLKELSKRYRYSERRIRQMMRERGIAYKKINRRLEKILTKMETKDRHVKS